MLLLLPSKSPFAKSPTDFFAASTRNDATRREERCAIFLLATVLAGAARNANFCADAATNEDMSITLTCVFWRSDAREKCRFPDWICVDYKSQSMMMMMDIYSTKRTTLEREKRREHVFFLPSFFPSSSSGKTHERMKKERLKTTERRFYTFTRGKHTHTHARTPKTKEEEEEQKKEKMPSSDMSLGFLLKYTRLAQKTKTKKKRRRKKYANNKSDDAVLFKKHFRFRL